MMIKLFVESLGCPKNTVDTELMIGYLKYSGDVTLTDNIKESDVILINTCGFIEPAKEESIDEILNAIEVKKQYKNKKIVVAGCLYERYKEELKKSLPEVDEFIGVYNLESITQKILGKKFSNPKPYLLRDIITPKHIGYLKIAEGCSNGCSFCAIPLIKGGFKSRGIDELMEEASCLADKGVKELYIIAQDTTAYMFDKNKKDSITELLRNLETIDGIEWIRLMYTYPSYITDKLLETMASSKKILNYIDVPFQHVNNKVLKSMNRKYTKKEILELVKKLKDKNITIRSTFIVGYPEETQSDFDELCDFLENYELDWVGFFKYYHEENTQAYKLRDLSESIKNERVCIAEELQEEIYLKKHQQMIGKEFDIIIDKKSDEMPNFFEARTKRSAYEIDGIVFIEGKNLKPGKIIRAKMEQIINNTDFIATAAKNSIKA